MDGGEETMYGYSPANSNGIYSCRVLLRKGKNMHAKLLPTHKLQQWIEGG